MCFSEILMWKFVLVSLLCVIAGMSAPNEYITSLNNLIPKCTPPQSCTKTCLLNFQKDVAGNCLCECATSRVIFGDIIINEATYRIQEKIFAEAEQPVEKSRKVRAALRNPWGEWPNNGSHVNIPYHLDPELSSTVQQALALAIEIYKNKTCVRFTPMTDDQSEYLSIKLSANSLFNCSAGVGYVEAGQQMFLGQKCGEDVGIVLHELMHILGFYHEQQRPDRDRFVRINWKNIPQDMWDQFKMIDRSLWQSGSRYDLHSVMQYSSWAFQIDTNIPTMFERWHGFVIPIHEQDLSEEDVRQIQSKYCPESLTPRKNTPNSSQRRCKDRFGGSDIWGARSECKRRNCFVNSPFMRSQCTFTCRVCRPPIFCRDYAQDDLKESRDYCLILKRAGYCQSDSFFMRSFCRFTCEACKVKNHTPHCQDIDAYNTIFQASSCMVWKHFGLCANDTNFMRAYCPVTCRLCPEGSITKSCKDDCLSRDNTGFRDCVLWKNDGLCVSDQTFMRAHCARTCNFCYDATF